MQKKFTLPDLIRRRSEPGIRDALICAKGDVIAGMFIPHEVRVFVDSYQITGNDQVHIFCPEQTQGYVQNSFYSSSFAPENFPSAQNVLHLSKDIAKKQDFIALGFDFTNLWQWGQTQNGFPFF